MPATTRATSLFTPRRILLGALPLALGALMINGSEPQAAPEPPAPPAVFERVPFADVIARAQPAVVKIEVTKTVRGIGHFRGGAPSFREHGPFGDFMRRFMAPGGRNDGPTARAQGVGSGFVVDTEGHIVTNHHVVDGAEDIKVTLDDGRELRARLVGHDPLTDLAVLQVEHDDALPVLEFGDSDRTRVGDWVVAIGSPFGFGGSATAGIVSARGRDIRSGPYDDFLQIDAPINSGNSGGPIVDASGRVVGVNTAIYSPNGGNIGIGFAIPANEASRIVNDLIDDGKVTRGWLGVQIQPVTEDLAAALALPEPAGALVAEVVDDGPAARAGVRPGDVIVSLNGDAVVDPRGLSRAVAALEPGVRARFEVIREGRNLPLTTVIANNSRVAAADAGSASADGENTPEYGLALGAIGDAERARFDIGDDQGAFVLGVKRGGPADNGGIEPGDVIVRVNERTVADVSDATDALAAAARQARPVVVLVKRGTEQFFATMKTG